MPGSNDDRKYFSLSMSKARYQQVVQILEQALENDPDKIEPTLEKIRELFNFDPNRNTYHSEYGNTQIERRRRLQQETGKSTYELFNKKYASSNKKKSNE